MSGVIDKTVPKQKAQIFLQGASDPPAGQRQAATLEALAGLMGVSPGEIEVYNICRGCVEFELGVPASAAQRLRSHLLANNAQLRLMGVNKVILQRPSGSIEAWSLKQGRFELEVSLDADAGDNSGRENMFVPGIWRFHVIYLLVTLVMGLAIFPYSQFISLLLLSGVCAFGLILSVSRRFMAAHILAVAIGLGAPVVVFARLLPAQTVIFFLCLLIGLTLIRRFLF